MTSISIVAGEPSGDLLASRIIRGLNQKFNDLETYGIGGDHMAKEGFKTLYPMSILTVFGYVDALKRLPSLVSTYKGLKRTLIKNKPDVFIGIDAPDFNLRLEKQLKNNSIPTLHFVGPSIWAWRYERIYKIKDSVSHMLVLFPFEEEIYKKEGISVTYVGHPLAAQIPHEVNKNIARKSFGLNLKENDIVMAILPGSRNSEINQLSDLFFQTALRIQKAIEGIQFLVPVANESSKKLIEDKLTQFEIDNIHLISTNRLDSSKPASWAVMQACDCALVSSGTATLELALHKKPMVISYKLTPLMIKIMKWKSGQTKPLVPWVGLPNILLNEFAVPEFLQDEATVENLSSACLDMINNIGSQKEKELISKFSALHKTLNINTPQIVADVVASYV
ncbi:lipid-A-disaccharide synthase [Taylorella equigenitalis]|uniref:lipid-A-disaccharide synthase n=1 Tax=Taylorella equigenitalis TaxID=29575 RepID=UPI0004014327|nr:lipid-A-disaccharide synthase [Taylorella equigenitalis]WDU47199.1 lipid-A-disaccharide synthase [Taylorella equigenitalis]WDU52580.1 lipid-A-disaccharide synthase [Taylorella equigenitalis]WDU52702.1 lipid-A-disaccharide synthase [Taylorella equigenitalis]WDU54158.1 lipid-A-disaccharide synthase [Taylorella equigenitalis]WED99721.1 lipid-A-disaccharide synthase [Taylorella equigenitalis]